ncbi:alpha-2-macroglobulin-like protein 1 isoform X1 [Poeciliopsis prolifica]|uniref:alpha-2-macroglobulin-like protein 1 isoform X1 n=1 Tax=Poeciliopsis prolifica TaxID=188132 RepID=UPI0024137A13|nr:alpha-2-macroglobulin-like protein 1 isoform X1 [Poeciliopsis prolifica]
MAPVLRVLAAAMFASALLLTATWANLNETIYAVTVSSRVTGGKQETLCAHVQNPAERLSLSVSLTVESTSSVILEAAVSEEFYRCLSFQVPAVPVRRVAVVQVTLAGEGASMSKKTKIVIEPPGFIHIVQTDKPIYKPGQTVKFRIVSLDASFIPVVRVYKEVVLQNPNSNRIAQWLNQTISGGILDLSHASIPEAAQGTYTISVVTDKEEEISHTFDIKEYVLPKFEVKVDLPSVITILDTTTTFKICGKYTYGKPVLGRVKAEFCRKYFLFFWRSDESNKDICKSFDLTLDKSGCASETVSLAEFALNKFSYSDRFELNAELEEDGTGVVLKGSGTASLSSQIRTITFENVPGSYKPGIPFEGEIKLVGPDSQPVANELLYLLVEDSKKMMLTTDTKGIAQFSLDTSEWKSSVSLKVLTKDTRENEPYVHNLRRPDYGLAYLFVSPAYSKSNSFLMLKHISNGFACDRDATVTAHYIIQGTELKEGQTVLNFFYLVLSKGETVRHGSVPVNVTTGTVNKGELTVRLSEVIDLAPVAQVIVYSVMANGEMVADNYDFPIQLCLSNKVSLKFSSVQQLPAEQTTLSLKANPKSLCSIRAIDQSVLLLKPEQELTVDYVFNQLPVQKLSGYDYEVEDLDPFRCFPRPIPRPIPDLQLVPEAEVTPTPTADVNVRPKRSLFLPSLYQKIDVYSIFKDIGVKLLTNSDVKKPFECIAFKVNAMPEALPMVEDVVMLAAPASNNQAGIPKETIRTNFLETWIWDLVSVGDGGSASLQKTVPDTITKWAASAFCVSPTGFGVSPNTGLTAFQPFFVSLTLPYSVIRGEVFTLKATVFNYLSQCIMVKVTLAESDQFTFRDYEGYQYSICLCGEESKTFSWIVTPTALGDVSLRVSAEALRTRDLCGNEVTTVPDVGRIDTVVRTLLVEAEGTPQMKSHNALLCPADGPVEKKISLQLPEMFVEGSARASVSVLGDLLGRALQNLDKLLAMPYGCGEQNMVLFAPNIFILNYLKSSSQLTETILEKATRFLESGYQRELNYKHDDGSYSAFGNSDPSGNTWLTAFVMKSFGGARDYIYVDPQHIKDARTWLSRLQKSDGCFTSVGKLFHNSMKGGVSDDVSLTAYIVAAMLELDGVASDPVVQKGLSCLKDAVAREFDNLYTMALMTYTFSLAGDQEMRSKLVTILDQKAKQDGGTIHWERVGSSDAGLDAVEVEMTSYVLLGLLLSPPLEGFSLDYTSGIIRWLAQQQNPYGGFLSTQDTVVALQALAMYAEATYSPQGITTVTVTSLGGLRKEFTVTQSNRLLYQEEELSEVPGEYTVRAEGHSCVLTQISAHYNIPPPDDFSSFTITKCIEPQCKLSRPQLHLAVHVRYQGRREETNMVIINIKLLSGYVLDQSSLQLLKNEPSVKRVDSDEGFLNIYLDGLKKDELQTCKVTLEEDQRVRNLKPAVIKVYDYYQPTDQAATDYTSPCAESKSEFSNLVL